MDANNPLLLTLTIDDEAQQYFNTLRKKYFPPERNYLDAHLMLFHQLPQHDIDLINDIETVTFCYAPMVLQVTALVGIGRGVAFKIESADCSNLHRQLQLKWDDFLIPQDKQRLWPHITIQNKVTPDEAKGLINELSPKFKPFEITGTGLSLFEYQGGPWKFLQNWKFTAP